ncbi:MAG: histidine kinase dimerization/phospho-acceptor domain-containing protein, partial [Gammaproteobacteria bacterium]
MTFSTHTSGAALAAAPARAEAWQPAQLAEAFATFETASETLADCYQRLETRVAELTDALSHSRAALETELQAKERLATRLSALLEALPGGVIVLDGQGCLAQFNPAARDLLGPLALHEPWIRVVARAFAPHWDDGHDISLVDGRLVNVSTAALVGEPGQILLITDVSETRSLQEQLNHHRRLSAKTELAAVLAHQVRTPLATALLQLGMLNGANLLPEAQGRARHKALVAMRQLERLVNDMLSYARGGVIAAEPIALDGLLSELQHTIDTEAAGAGFEFNVRQVSDPSEIMGEIMGSRSALL